MKVDISQPGDPDGPFLVELEELLTHRVLVSFDDRTLLDDDLRSLFTRGLLHGENKTVLRLGSVQKCP